MNSRVDFDEAKRLRIEGHLTLREIGERFGVTRERIRQVTPKAGYRGLGISKKKKYWQRRLFVLKDITFGEIARQHNLCTKTVRAYLGSCVGYLKQRGLKHCGVCKKIKPASEFYLGRNGILSCVCKPCNTIRCREAWNKNRGKYNAVRKKWAQANPGRIKATRRRYQTKHRQKYLATRRAQYHRRKLRQQSSSISPRPRP